MKHHLTIILLALRAGIIIVAGMAVIYAYSAYSYTITPDDTLFGLSYFKIKPNALRPLWGAPLFLALYSLLLGYLTYVLAKLYKSFSNLQKGNVFYEKQSAQFKSSGSGIIIFAKCKYLLFCAFGAIFFSNISIFIAEALPFITMYLIGKFILVLYYMAEKGEYLREENELTI